ncbi:hypothetical protein [Sanguibacter suaedae]|uniref:Uncharacterized protein n=1 Tax=Sanguibacter suaedae TaxID=2795737 RepID=A0A934MDC1_9MICO|nr:hypothetical protein [Sanguibacter suaedae]MBI9114674.1 hypothetical protein [Sanguibacter suaedae]
MGEGGARTAHSSGPGSVVPSGRDGEVVVEVERPGSPVLFGVCAMAVAAAAVALHVDLVSLHSAGVLYYRWGVSSVDVEVLALAASVPALVVAVCALLPPAVRLVRPTWARVALGTLCAVLVTAGAFAAGGLAMYTAVVQGRDMVLIASPDEDRTLLVHNRSVLHAGRHDLYEGVGGGRFESRATLRTADGYDPFMRRDYTIDWHDGSATLAYRDDAGWHEEEVALASPLVP